MEPKSAAMASAKYASFFPKSISEMLGFSFRSLPRGARFERSLRVTGAGAAEMAWEEATEGERGVSGR